ncbi:hypothetical protein ABPG74_013315 [Tetrahymena malaccensis]
MDNFFTKSQKIQKATQEEVSQNCKLNDVSDCVQSNTKECFNQLRQINPQKQSQSNVQNTNMDLSSYNELQRAFLCSPKTELKANSRQQIGKEYSNQVNYFGKLNRAQLESQKTNNNLMSQQNQPIDEVPRYKSEAMNKNMKIFCKFCNSFKEQNDFERKIFLFSFLKAQQKYYTPQQVEIFININELDELKNILQKIELKDEFLQFLNDQKKYTKSFSSQLKEFIKQRNLNNTNVQLNEDIYKKNKYNFVNYLNRLQNEKFFKKFYEKVLQINSPESKMKVCPEIPIYHYYTILREFLKKYNNNNSQDKLPEEQVCDSQDSQQKSEKSQEANKIHNLNPQANKSQIFGQKDNKVSEIYIQNDSQLQISSSSSMQGKNNKKIKKRFKIEIKQKIKDLEIQNEENKKLQSLNSQIQLDILQVLQNQRDDQTKFNKLIYEGIQELISNIKKLK